MREGRLHDAKHSANGQTDILVDSRDNIKHCAFFDYELVKDERTEALISAMGLLD